MEEIIPPSPQSQCCATAVENGSVCAERAVYGNIDVGGKGVCLALRFNFTLSPVPLKHRI